MKKLVKGLVLSTALVLGLSISSNAQETGKRDFKGERPALNLTEAQKAQMKSMREQEKANRDKFEATLSDEQKAIMKDKTINPKEKKEKLAGMFTAEQKKMMEANRAEAKKRRDEFSKTLSPEQKAEFEKMKDRRGEMGKGFKKGSKPTN